MWMALQSTEGVPCLAWSSRPVLLWPSGGLEATENGCTESQQCCPHECFEILQYVLQQRHSGSSSIFTSQSVVPVLLMMIVWYCCKECCCFYVVTLLLMLLGLRYLLNNVNISCNVLYVCICILWCSEMHPAPTLWYICTKRNPIV